MADIGGLANWDLDYEETEQASGFTALRLVLIADPDENPRVGAQRAAVTELAGQRGVGCPSSPWTVSIRWCGWPASSS